MAPQSPFQRWYPLVLISFISLFTELAVIRWISGEIRLFAYFKNLPLLAAFLGLAIGFGLVSRERVDRNTFPALLALLGLLVVGLNRLTAAYPLAYPGGGDEFLWNAIEVSDGLLIGLFLGAVLVLFLMTTFLFIPLGQATGKEMALSRPVPAYVVNIAASLLGVWAFTLVSSLETPPVIWFGLAALGFGFYQLNRRQLTWITMALFASTLLLIYYADLRTLWSPYQRLDLWEEKMIRQDTGEPIHVGYRLEVQQSFHQHAIDLSDGFMDQLDGQIPEMQALADSYNLPYLLIEPGSEILVVGAGMGNDVAAGLRNGAAQITAVEIDPGIIALGEAIHPESPYMDPRAHAIVDDARSFLNKSSDRYDAVVFGLLDSHTLLSSLSSVRLDSFVYTVESFEQVRAHLKENGKVIVTFLAVTPWIEERLGRMLTLVFGPDAVYVRRGQLGTTFVAGKASPDQLTSAGLAAWMPEAEFDDLPIPTDDWPYLYLRSRKIPAVYWQALLVIGVACLILIARNFPETLRPDWHFWFLGAAFLLIEFKSITELALLFGTTWLVNALAITGVLLMILLANLLVLKRKSINLRWAYGLLLATLALLFLFPIRQLGELAFGPRLVASLLLLSSPLFFSGIIFSESLRRAGETSRPLASNLSGTLMGGFLEYGSLMWGIKSLYPLAIVLYLVAYLFSRLQTKV